MSDFKALAEEIADLSNVVDESCVELCMDAATALDTADDLLAALRDLLEANEERDECVGWTECQYLYAGDGPCVNCRARTALARAIPKES